MRFFLTFLLLFLVSVGFSQNSENLKPGIYKSYEEFINNQPSLALEYTITENIVYCEKNLYPGQRKASKQMPMVRVGEYSLKVTKSEKKKIGPVIGFSDGVDVYFSDGSVIINKDAVFLKAEFIGDSHYFFLNWTEIIVDREGSAPNPITGQGGVSRIDHCVLNAKVVSSKTCKGIILNEYEVEKIVEDDFALIVKFKSDPNREFFLKQYVEEYIKRNLSQEAE